MLCLLLQLHQFGRSQYFRVENQKLMTGNTEARSGIVQALIDVAKEFATRSIDVAKTAQRRNQRIQTDGVDADQAEALQQAELMTSFKPSSWQDSNHLLVVFQRQFGGGTISALYRDAAQVPEHIQKLLDGQPGDSVKYTDMDENALRKELEKLVRSSGKKLEIKDNYALTSDNMLKMALVVLRIRARIPVVIMGHSGCGKTSLLSYLRQVCEVPEDRFQVLNVHAGITSDDIQQFVRGLQKQV
eukprot:COSAG06_NODE_15889_length_1037_cov_1.262260_1_plen_243_part_10